MIVGLRYFQPVGTLNKTLQVKLFNENLDLIILASRFSLVGKFLENARLTNSKIGPGIPLLISP